MVVARVGSRRSLQIALPAFAVMLAGPALAPNLAVLTIAVGLSAAVNSVVGVALNEQGESASSGNTASWTARLGSVTVFRLGALTAGIGFAAGLLAGTPATAMIGLACLGLGLANLLPLAISAAGNDGRLPVAVAVARVSMLGYLGSFAGPAIIGLLVTGIPLAYALLLPAVGVALTTLGATLTRTPTRAFSKAVAGPR